MSHPIQTTGLDHIVLRIVDKEKMIAFYRDVLGCKVDRDRPELGLTHIRAGSSLIDLVTVDGKLYSVTIIDGQPEIDGRGPRIVGVLDELANHRPAPVGVLHLRLPKVTVGYLHLARSKYASVGLFLLEFLRHDELPYNKLGVERLATGRMYSASVASERCPVCSRI